MKNIIRAIYIMAVALFLTACSEVGIFYALEHEEKIKEKNNLNNGIRFSTMVDTNPGNASGYYIGNAGLNIYYRSKASTWSRWSKISFPSEYDGDSTSSSLVLVDRDGGTNYDLYVSMINHDNHNSGIYKILDINSNIGGSPTWTPLEEYNGSSSTYRIFKLHTAGQNNLYINQLIKDGDGDTTGSSLLHSGSADTDAFAAFANITSNVSLGSSEEILSIGYATTGTYYWAAFNNSSQGEVWRSGATNADFSGATNETNNISERLVDFYIYPQDDRKILISNVDGSIYISDDASVADPNNWSTKGSITGVYNGFADIHNVDGNTNIVLVGVAATIATSNLEKGYHQLNMATESIEEDNSFSDTNNYNSSELSTASIAGFLVDEANERIFSYTYNAGVWLNILDDGERIWTRE